MRELTKDEVEFEVLIESEDMSVRGNYMCTEDPKADKQAEDEIIARLKNNDIYAWCVIKVTAKWEEFEGFAVLGGVSFSESEDGDKQAKEMAGEYGMFEQALDNLNAEVKGYVMNACDIQVKLAE